MPLSFVQGKPLPRHHAYAVQAQARSFWRRSYWAEFGYADGVDAGGNGILPSHPRETDERYASRKSMAMPRKYARSIIDRYNDHANRKEAIRQEAADGTPYGLLRKDATGSGMPLPTLMRRAMRWAQIERCSYLLADSNVAGVFLSAAQEAAAGKRGVLRLVRADQVLWWKDWQGLVDEALVTFTDRSGALFAWYVTPAFVQRIDYEIGDGRVEKITAIGPEIPHTYGGCPLTRCEEATEDGGDPPNDSQCAPLADAMRRILNIESWELEELQGATFTTHVFLGAAQDQVHSVVVGAGKGLAIPGNGTVAPALGKIGADPAQAESLRTALAREVRELYRVAGLVSGNPTEVGAPESGVARAFAFNEVEARLSALADGAEAAENLAVRRLAAGFGWEYPGDAQWPDTFDTPDLAVELDTVIRTSTAQLPQVLKDAQVRQYADAAFKLTPEQKRDLEKQLEQQAVDAASRAADPFVNPQAPGRMVGT